jgi:hypothetical protein
MLLKVYFIYLMSIVKKPKNNVQHSLGGCPWNKVQKVAFFLESEDM